MVQETESRELDHRHYIKFLKELVADHTEVPYQNHIPWKN